MQLKLALAERCFLCYVLVFGARFDDGRFCLLFHAGLFNGRLLAKFRRSLFVGGVAHRVFRGLFFLGFGAISLTTASTLPPATIAFNCASTDSSRKSPCRKSTPSMGSIGRMSMETTRPLKVPSGFVNEVSFSCWFL